MIVTCISNSSTIEIIYTFSINIDTQLNIWLFSFLFEIKIFEISHDKIKYGDRLMPRPSARTKYFLSWTKLKLPKTKFLSRVKNYIFCFQKVMQNEYLLLKIDFQSGNFVLNYFWKQKMYFLTLDKNFMLDNFGFVQDKKYFVRAEGRGIKQQK